MNLSPLRDVLNAVLKRGIAAAPLPSEIRKDSVLARHWRESNVLASRDTVAFITDEINRSGIFPRKDWVYVEVPDGYGYQLSIAGVSYWLLARSFHTSVDSALNELRSFVEEEPRRCSVVVGLAGIDVVGSVEMATGIRLCHPDSAPPSPHLEEWTWNPPRTNTSSLFSMRVSAVLVAEEKAPVCLSAKVPMPLERISKKSVGENRGLTRIARLLPLFGPNAATSFSNWIQMDEPSSIPGFDWYPRGGSGIGEMLTSVHSPFVDDLRRDEITRAYEARNWEEGTLPLALSRFSQAMRRQKLEDTAIELRIALEVLLANDREHAEPITHLISQRGALVLGTTPEERKSIAKELRETYGATSAAVHTGKLKNEKQKEAVRTGLKRCAEIIKRFILRAPPDDWNELVFTANTHW